jgi:hypothetical protein
MKASGYLLFNAKGITGFRKGGTKNNRQTPALAPGERAVYITIVVPDSVFRPIPTASATIQIPESQVIEPAVEVTVGEAP